MVKSNSGVVEYIHSNHITKVRKGCGIQRSVRNARAYDLCRFGVNDGLKGLQGARNLKSRHKTSNLPDKLPKTSHSPQDKLRMTIKIDKQALYVLLEAQMIIPKFAIN